MVEAVSRQRGWCSAPYHCASPCLGQKQGREVAGQGRLTRAEDACEQQGGKERYPHGASGRRAPLVLALYSSTLLLAAV